MKIRRNKTILQLQLVGILMIIALLAVYFGTVSVGMADIRSIFSEELTRTGYILKYIRIPRVCASVLSGMGLAVSGVVIQTIFHNPLASPSIIGVNSGAGLFVVLCSAFLPEWYGITPFAAFFGAFLTVGLVYYLGAQNGASKYAILIAGMAISSLISSVTETVYLINDDYMINNKMFRLGSLGQLNSKVLPIAAVIILCGMTGTFFLHNQLEILSLGDETACSLGLSVKKYRLIFLLLAAVLAGASISFVGMIGFVGLIVPHIARIFIGDECRCLLGVSALLGGILVTLCDLIGRIILAPYEIPVGIILSFLGVPFFLLLLYSQRRKNRYDSF